MKEAFLYCWTDSKTNKLYVGYHKGSNSDGYICSSKSFLKEYKKRPHDFTRQIIAEGSREDMVKLESVILSSIDAKNDPKMYNLNNGGGDFFSDWSGKRHSAHSRTKMSASQKGNKNCLGRRLSEETIGKLSEAAKGKVSPRKGAVLSEETKLKLRNAHLGKKLSPESIEKTRLANLGRPAWNRGKNHTEETKMKMRGPRGKRKKIDNKEAMEQNNG